MHMRLMQVRIRPEKVSEAVLFYDEHVIPMLQRVPECLSACFLMNVQHPDECISLTVWNTKAGAEAYERGKVFQGLVADAREFLAASSEWRIELKPDLTVPEAMKLTVNRHYPQYPVCDFDGKLVGLVRGAALFELEAFEITAQAGAMVGVEKEERISTSIPQSFKYRNPWLLINLLTAFAAGGVVAIFQGTLDKLIILAAFLPVLAGQSGNTGCQALAVTIRGITLGDIKPGAGGGLVSKEALLGLANGIVTGVLCGIAMYLLAVSQSSPHALMLGVVVALAMTGSCAVSGISGAIVPLALKRMGADPATASSIFVTTATDVASMGLLLGLAALMIR